MPAKADIVLDSPLRGRLLLVECKWAKESSPASAAHLRDSLSRLWNSDAAFFMLAFRTGLYLWKKDTAPNAPPDFVSPAKQVLREYLGKLADQADGPRAESMELAIASWLSDLASDLRKPDPKSEADQMLVKSGLYEQMKHGIVRTEVET
jgi:hypothetical protein